jgi:4-azaleucine resistance transporter AzlC
MLIKWRASNQAKTKIAPRHLRIPERFWRGVRTALPFIPGVAVFGLVFGALAVSNGLSPLAAVIMSVLVAAGSSQFVALELIDDGTSIGVILLATLMINLRNALYSASLSPLFGPLSRVRQWLLAYSVADENYGLAITQNRKNALSGRQLVWFYTGTSFTIVSAWWVASAAGAAAVAAGATVVSSAASATASGGQILAAEPTQFLAFISPLVFTSLVVPLLVTRPALLAAISAAFVAILLNPLPHQMGLLAAATAGITSGMLAERRFSS